MTLHYWNLTTLFQFLVLSFFTRIDFDKTQGRTAVCLAPFFIYCVYSCWILVSFSDVLRKGRNNPSLHFTRLRNFDGFWLLKGFYKNSVFHIFRSPSLSLRVPIDKKKTGSWAILVNSSSAFNVYNSALWIGSKYFTYSWSV